MSVITIAISDDKDNRRTVVSIGWKPSLLDHNINYTRIYMYILYTGKRSPFNEVNIFRQKKTETIIA